MAVPTDITDLSATASSNSPAGTDSIGTDLDDYMRAIQAIIKQNVSKGADIASSTTITIPDVGGYFVVTGTTAITGINDTWNGRTVMLKFSGIVTLTNSAGLILGADITTAAGDVLILTNESTGVYRLVKGKEIIDNGGIIRGNLFIGDGTTGRKLDIRHDGTNAPAVRLLRNDGTAAGIIYTDPSTDVLILSQMDTDGTTVLSSITLNSGIYLTEDITITPAGVADAGINIDDDLGNRRLRIEHLDPGVFNLKLYDSSGALQTTLSITPSKVDSDVQIEAPSFHATSNVSVGAATPIDDDDLTRKDFVVGLTDTLTTAVNLKSPIANPTFTGVPSGPTAAADTDTAQFATTAFVQQEINNQEPSAWCVFNGSTAGDNAPIAGYNISSVERTAAGRYTINIDTDLDNANYAVVLSSSYDLTYTGWLIYEDDPVVNRTAGLFKAVTVNTSYVDSDAARVTVMIYGGKA